VNPNGDNSNDGSSESPWQTIQYAIDQAAAGDIIYVRDGVYNELVEFHNSGSEDGGYITLTNDVDHAPIIDGTGLGESSEEPGLIRMQHIEYVKVIGFELRNLTTMNDYIFPAGIWVVGESHHIEIRDMLVHHIEQNHESDGGSHGIAVYGTSAAQAIHDVIIDHCEVRDCALSWSESLVLNGNVTDFVISNNRVHDNNNIGIVCIGHEETCPDPELDQARNGIVADNIVYNIDSRSNPAYQGEASADGFYSDGGKNIIFERNIAYQCNIGFEVASEHGNKSTSGIIVRNNFLFDNHVVGLAIGGYDELRGEAFDCHIVNNTFYHNNADNIDWGAEFLQNFYCHDNTIRNNIFYSRSGTPLLINESQTGEDNSFDYNLYYSAGDPIWIWDSVEYSAFQDFQTSVGQELFGLYSDPFLIDPGNGDLHLPTSSPAKERGQNLATEIIGSTDIDGDDRIINVIVDIGADEVSGIVSAENVDSQCDQPILFCAFPNPFADQTAIRYRVEKRGVASLQIFNISGQLVKTLVSNTNSAGSYQQTWDGANESGEKVGPGVYFYCLTVGDAAQTRKMALIR